MKNQNEAELFLLEQFENILDVLWCSENRMFVDELSVAKKEQKGSAKKEGMPDNPNSASTKTNQKKSEVTESVYTKEKRFKTSTSLKGDTLNLPKRQILQKHRKWEKA
ncbi:MAG: hypothetical protein K0U38_07490, partial [Epsilonproteobacteria bacterium]|nr:hypothetical protein [Campylobacterota bacterium]